MHRITPILQRVFVLMAALLAIKVTATVLFGYRNYFPPNFDAEFLYGRQPYFYGTYQWAFYIHLVSGPLSLLLGMILVSNRFRLRFPAWHKRLGRIQAACVLFLVAPSGLWMSGHAMAGPVAGVGLGVQAILTGGFVAMGWRAAIGRRFVVHQRWMSRTFILLCSAVVIRLVGGAAVELDVKSMWFDPIASWSSWLVPLALFEAVRLIQTPRGDPVWNRTLSTRPKVA